jgi:hypothetical protein
LNRGCRLGKLEKAEEREVPMLPFGKDSEDEEVLDISKGEYKLTDDGIVPIANKPVVSIKIKPEMELPAGMYAIGKRMRYADGDANKLLMQKARLICRKENLDWFVAMSFLKDITSGTIIH